MEARAPSREDRIAYLRERDGDSCMYPGCDEVLDFSIENGPKAPTIDHWIPLALGGGWENENLKIMTRRCNQYKGDLLPNSDGSIPKRKRSTFKRRHEKRLGRQDLCESCMSGRLLEFGQECAKCGSGPQPNTAPTAYQLRPKECPHEGPWHCWMCFGLALIPRKSAIVDVLDGDYFDE